METEIARTVRQMRAAGLSFFEAVREFKKGLIVDALRDARGNACRAARALGTHRNTLRRQMQDLGISTSEIRSDWRTQRALRFPAPLLKLKRAA